MVEYYRFKRDDWESTPWMFSEREADSAESCPFGRGRSSLTSGSAETKHLTVAVGRDDSAALTRLGVLAPEMGGL